METGALSQTLVAFVEPTLRRLRAGKKAADNALDAINLAAKTLLEEASLGADDERFLRHVVALTDTKLSSGKIGGTDLERFAATLRRAIVSAQGPDSLDARSLRDGSNWRESGLGESPVRAAGAPETSSFDPGTDDSPGSSSALLRLIKVGIVAVPATRYALGAVGIAACAELVLLLFEGHTAYAIFGTLLAIAFSVLVLVFSNLAKAKAGTFRGPAVVLMWVIVAVFSLSVLCLFTSAFFDIPLPLRRGLIGESRVPSEGSAASASSVDPRGGLDTRSSSSAPAGLIPPGSGTGTVAGATRWKDAAGGDGEPRNGDCIKDDVEAFGPVKAQDEADARIESRYTRLDLSAWVKVSPEEQALGDVRSQATVTTKLEIVRRSNQGKWFVHGYSSSENDIEPMISSYDHFCFTRPVAQTTKIAPTTWKVYFDISREQIDTAFPLVFDVHFANNFQQNTEWSGFMIRHPTGRTVYEIVYPDSRKALASSITFEYVTEPNETETQLSPELVDERRPAPRRPSGNDPAREAGTWTRQLSKDRTKIDSLKWTLVNPAIGTSYKVHWNW